MVHLQISTNIIIVLLLYYCWNAHRPGKAHAILHTDTINQNDYTLLLFFFVPMPSQPFSAHISLTLRWQLGSPTWIEPCIRRQWGWPWLAFAVDETMWCWCVDKQARRGVEDANAEKSMPPKNYCELFSAQWISVSQTAPQIFSLFFLFSHCQHRHG